jgi:RNA polymerase sigma factor (sigma-70 family)
MDLLKLHKQAVSMATKKGFGNDAEDFAQEATLLLHAGRKARLDQLLTDYLRKEYGSTRHSNTPTKEYLARECYHEIDPNRTRAEAIPSHMEFLSLLKTLPQAERVMVILKYQWGLDQREIAEAFGVTESRISQKLTEAHQRLQTLLETS